MSKTYKKILLSHDGSELASEAIDHVITLANAYDAEVIVLHVVDSVVKIINSISSTNAAFGAQSVYKDVAKREKEAARNSLKRVKQRILDGGVSSVHALIQEGDARDEIVAIAKEQQCDMIVMSTHGRSGIRRALLGSVAEDVVRHSPCPVLLIHVKK